MKAQATREAAARRRITLAGLIRAARVFSIPVSVLPVVLATAVALPVGQWRWDILAASALVCPLAAVLVFVLEEGEGGWTE